MAAPVTSTAWCNLSAYTRVAENGRKYAAEKRGVDTEAVSIGEASPVRIFGLVIIYVFTCARLMVRLEQRLLDLDA